MKFSLRQKLYLVFGILLLIIAFIGIQSIQRFYLLGHSIDVILRENYRSVIACQQMKEAVERIDSGILFVLLGKEKQGREMIMKNLAGFREALAVELNNLTLPEETDKALRLKSLFSQYEKKLSVAMTKKIREFQEIYFTTLLPIFHEIKITADNILQMNQQNMMLANNRARVRSTNARRDMFLFLLVSSILAAIFIFFSNQWILKPIQRLIRSAIDIKNGNLNLVVRVDTHDEIGQLSETFNSMVESLRFHKRSEHSKLMRILQSTQEVFRYLPEVIVIVDDEGMIEVATESARIHFNLVPNIRILGTSQSWLVNLYQYAIEHQKRNLREYKFEVIQHFINNQEKFFQPRAFPILDSEKDLSGLIIILEDVTLLKQSDEIKKNLLSTISHQLKTPLTSMRMAIHLLLDEKIGNINEKQTDLLLTARDESDRLYGIIEDLLDISRIESGNIKMHLTPVSPYELVKEAVEPFNREAMDKGIALEIDLPPDLAFVAADQARISHVFSNLLANAIKYTPYGGRVHVRAKPEDDRIKFYISDTGPGIPKKYQARVFEKFFRIPGQVPAGGEGLGLAIAKEIIKAHNGEISFESKEGEGTTFMFTLVLHEKNKPESHV